MTARGVILYVLYLLLSVVINGFNPKTGASEGGEHLLTQFGAMALVINIFL